MNSTSAAETSTQAVSPVLICRHREPPRSPRGAAQSEPSSPSRSRRDPVRFAVIARHPARSGARVRCLSPAGTVAGSGRRRARSLLRAHAGVVRDELRRAHRRPGAGLAGDRGRRPHAAPRPDRLGQDARRVPLGDRPARHRRRCPPRTERCRVLYISPLRALAVDVEKNLRAPLAGIALAAERLGAAFHAADASRCAPATRRPRNASSSSRTPPDILITTPESLYLMLTSQAREIAAQRRRR